MENIVPMDLRSRLVRVGFAAADVDTCLALIGPGATLDRAVRWLSIRSLERCLRGANFERIADTTWEWKG
jgi:hypothetical protein